MKKHAAFWIRGVAFACVLALCLHGLGLVLAPKFDLKDVYPTTATLMEFYQLEEDSVDVLVLGSSHSMTAIDPQVLYDSWGYTAYNLSGEQQSAFLSSYLLEEAFKTQHPSVVVLETHFLFDYFDATPPLNTEEPYVHKALDFMKPSLTRLKAVAEAAWYRPDFGFFNLLFPAVRYHTRLHSLSREDYDRDRFQRTENLLGFGPQARLLTVGWYSVLEYMEVENAEPEPMMPLMAECLERMRSMCEANGAELLLIKTPSASQTPGRCRAMHDYADAHGLRFLDFNEEDVYYSQLEYDFYAYNADADHLNIWGAQRVSDYLGMVLCDEMGVEGRGQHPYWDEASIRHVELVESKLEEF